MSLRGMQSLAGTRQDNMCLCDATWQPLSLPASSVVAPNAPASVASMAEALMHAATALRRDTDSPAAVFRFMELQVGQRARLGQVDHLFLQTNRPVPRTPHRCLRSPTPVSPRPCPT
jgi:hypothetical protein